MNISDAWVLIPARMGSVELPLKNKKLLQGKPLIQYTLELALQIFSPKHIIVNTDDPEIHAHDGGDQAFHFANAYPYP